MPTINISQHENGVVRVFAVSRPMADMARALRQASKGAIASGLLRHEVTAEDIELFALSDLTGLGLRQYLTEGYSIPAEALQADRARLDALDGYVLLLLSRVSNEAHVEFTPSPDLTLIGTYREPRENRAAVPIAAQAAKPYSGVGPDTQTRNRLRMGGAGIGVTVILALLLIWWILR
jgi:hypothetical protein